MISKTEKLQGAKRAKQARDDYLKQKAVGELTPSEISGADTTTGAKQQVGRPRGTEKKQILRAKGVEEYRKLKHQEEGRQDFDRMNRIKYRQEFFDYFQ